MSCVFITSDWHLGHRAIAQYREGVNSVDHNTQILVDNYKSVVKKRDICWFLGDVMFEPQYLDVIADLPGTKHLVLGNHCTDRKVTAKQLCEVFDSVHGIVKYKDAWLTHCPIHPQELHGRINIHGHMHYNEIDFSDIYAEDYINVCVEHTGMTPIKYQEIIGKYN